MLSRSERERYLRQLGIEGFGEPEQEKLSRATVFIAGAGGLGCAAALYLAAAGVGGMRIADDGDVELSNLNRQIAYGDLDLGTPKVEAIARRIMDLNSHVRVSPRRVRLEDRNLPPLVEGCDAIVDALDNLPSRYALNRAALAAGVPILHGAVQGFYGQLMTVVPGRTPCLMCLYRGGVTTGPTPVIGVTPGVIGLLEAVETIKVLTGLGRPLEGVLLVFDGLRMSFDRLEIPRDPDCPACGTGGSAP